ncbi:MAG: PPC domain-containing protein [Anaerolineae bacterium]
MTIGRASWLAGIAGLMLLLAGLGCSVCPLVPRLPTATPSPPTDTPIPEATPTPEPTPTPETLTEMVLYTNPTAGLSILYPADWVYETENDDVYFAESEEALAYSDPTAGALFGIRTGSPEEMELQFGTAARAEDLLDSALEDLREEEAEIGESEARTFGGVPGAGVEAGWTDEQTGAQMRGYIIAAVGEEVAAVGFGVSTQADWPSYEPIFQDMFTSLELFPPEVPEPVERGPIQPGEMVEGTLPLGGVDIWYFEVEAGRYVTIRLDAVDPDALDTYLEIYDEDEVWITEDDDGGEGTNSLIAEFPIGSSGTYYIHALTYSGEGDYTLNLEITEEPSGGGPIKYGGTVEGVLAEGVQHEWVFDGEEGNVVNIAMNAVGEELDCYLELYGPDGLLLTDDDDSGEEFNALIEYYELPTDGTYRIVARGGLFGAAGAYELTLEQTETVVEGVLAYGETAKVTLEPGTRHHWLFEGEEGDVITISMTGVTEDMDTFLELFAPDGVRVMTDDDGGGDSNAEISEFELPLSGTYRIIARGYDDEDVGEYELTLTGP